MSKIKLVIEIDNEIYQEAIISGYSHLYDEDVANAVADGVPLDDRCNCLRCSRCGNDNGSEDKS